MESEVSKEDAEEIEACRRCPRLVRMEDRGEVVYIKCTPEDRFDCPHILETFYPAMYALPEEERKELIARIRSGRLTREDARYLT
jgi:hypothetical protein